MNVHWTVLGSPRWKSRIHKVKWIARDHFGVAIFPGGKKQSRKISEDV